MLIHHLRASRSHRILWLMEELGQPYEIRIYERDPDTMRAEPSLAANSPFGKAPAIEDGDLVLVESGAIMEHILTRHASGRLRPEPGTDQRSRHDELMHFAEATAMPALLTDVVAQFGAEIPDAARWILGPSASEVLDWLAMQLGDKPFLMGNALSAADMQVWFAMRIASSRADFADYPLLRAYLDRLEECESFKAAVARGGPVGMDR